MDMKHVLETLCGCTAPSGFEAPAAQAARVLLEPLVDETTIDRMGNLIGVRRCGVEGAKKVLLTPIWMRSALLSPGRRRGISVSAPSAGWTPACCPGGRYRS